MALPQSPFWKNTVVFVLEDDAQNGADRVDSHRSPMLVISAYNRPGAIHRFANTTDVLRTIEEIRGLESMSQFDYFGRPLRDIWADNADPRPYPGVQRYFVAGDQRAQRTIPRRTTRLGPRATRGTVGSGLVPKDDSAACEVVG